MKPSLRYYFGMLFLCLVGQSVALADYYRTGEVYATVCYGLGIEVCPESRLVAVKGEDGKAYEIAERYEKVTEFNEGNGHCWIQVKSRGLGLLSRAVNLFSTEFYRLNDGGEFEEVSPDSIHFDCVRR